MSLLVSQTLEHGEIGRVHHENVTKVTGDKQITESTIQELVKTKLLPMLAEQDVTNRSRINQIKGYSLTSGKCQAAIDLIEENAPLIQVVEDKENHHEESGLNLFVWEKIKYIGAEQTIALADDDDVVALKKRGAMPYPCIDVSQSAYNAMKRYVQVLKDQESRSRNYHTVSVSPAYQSSNYSIPSYPRPEKNRSCNVCVLL